MSRRTSRKQQDEWARKKLLKERNEIIINGFVKFMAFRIILFHLGLKKQFNAKQDLSYYRIRIKGLLSRNANIGKANDR